MTNEFIKVLMLFVLYGALQIALFSSSIGRLVSRAVRSPRREVEARSSDEP
jgi:hypothetical protein